MEQAQNIRKHLILSSEFFPQFFTDFYDDSVSRSAYNMLQVQKHIKHILKRRDNS